MAKKKFIVAPGRQVCHSRKFYREFDELPALSAKDEANLLNLGAIIDASSVAATRKSAEAAAKKQAKERRKSNGAKTSQQTLSPADLEGKSLDELNVIANEKGSETEFETVEAATAWLTKHHEEK